MPVLSFLETDKPGTMIPFAGPLSEVPLGYLPCNGDPVSRTTYARLFSVIGTYWGAGDGSTTFNLPDIRGRFLRGVDEGSGRDPDALSRGFSSAGGATGDSVGTVQGHSFGSHDHGGGSHGHGIDATSGAIIAPQGTGDAGTSGTLGNFGVTSTSNEVITKSSGNTIISNGGNETRPVNAGVHFIIKF